MYICMVHYDSLPQISDHCGFSELNKKSSAIRIYSLIGTREI